MGKKLRTKLSRHLRNTGYLAGTLMLLLAAGAWSTSLASPAPDAHLEQRR